MNESANQPGFPTTRWSRVAHAVDPAAPDAQDALAELCMAYWYPIYAFVRRKGHDPDESLDLTQDYFTRLLETGVLASADERHGRFRAFLRTDCGFFLSHQHERGNALKRGGGRMPLSIDARDAEGRYLREPVDNSTPERHFDQRLGAELVTWTSMVESGPPQAKPLIAHTLNYWKMDPDLASVRDEKELAKLPKAERKEWQTLWANVNALLSKTKP